MPPLPTRLPSPSRIYISEAAMFLIRFATGSLIGAIVGIIAGILMLAVVLGVIVFSLMAVGGPDPCTPGGGEIVINLLRCERLQKDRAFEFEPCS